jgi:phage FluMu protein Com
MTLRGKPSSGTLPIGPVQRKGISMPFTIACTNCEKTLKVPDEMAGKKVRCPACKSVVLVPAANDEDAAIQEDAPAPKKKAAPPPLRKRRDEEEEEDEPEEEEDLDSDDDDEPRRKRKRYRDDDDEVDVRRKRKSSHAYALGRTAGPGIALMVCGGTGTVVFIAAAILNFIGIALFAQAGQIQVPAGQNPGAYQFGQVVGSVFMITINAVVGYGGYQIKTLSNYRSAMATAIVAMIPFCSPCYIIGIPFGIWALVVLLDERVKKSFTS